jgi:hypothetical protein
MDAKINLQWAVVFALALSTACQELSCYILRTWISSNLHTFCSPSLPSTSCNDVRPRDDDKESVDFRQDRPQACHVTTIEPSISALHSDIITFVISTDRYWDNNISSILVSALVAFLDTIPYPCTGWGSNHAATTPPRASHVGVVTSRNQNTGTGFLAQAHFDFSSSLLE